MTPICDRIQQENAPYQQPGTRHQDEKKFIRLREYIRDLYFIDHLAKNEISRRLDVSKHTVIAWTQSADQDCHMDGRGWQQGRRRHWQQADVERVRQIHHDLIDDPMEFYSGATAIAQEWTSRFPQHPFPPLRTIGQMLKDMGLSVVHKKGRSKGAAAYLCYPEHTVYSVLGSRVLESDFIGHKYLTGQSAPLNFISFSFKKPPKLRNYQRVEGQTGDVVMEQCNRFFTRFELPSHIKLDNASAMIGSASGKRNLSRVMQFLLHLQIIPIFAVPRKPFSQASIEGSNSVFARKFWKARTFSSIEDVDNQLAWFNDATMRYLGYQPPRKQTPRKRRFHPKVYFIRQVRHDGIEASDGYVDVLNERILLPASLVQYFVLAEWDLKTEQLLIHLERDQRTSVIHQQQFLVNSSTDVQLF
jgi:hypothetical protein